MSISTKDYINFMFLSVLTKSVMYILKVKNYPSSCKDEFGRLRVGAAVGVSADMYDRVAALIEVGVDFICVDTAHGHSKKVAEIIKEIKRSDGCGDVWAWPGPQQESCGECVMDTIKENKN